MMKLVLYSITILKRADDIFGDAFNLDNSFSWALVCQSHTIKYYSIDADLFYCIMAV
jgi:hypothetical protein